VIYTFLPVRIMTSCIMTSTLVEIYFASCCISKRGHPRMASLSVASLSALHSSVRYLLFFYTLLATVYFVVSRRCMMYPIIFLLLIVVSLSQKLFFLSSTSLFPLDPYLCAPQGRALEMWRGVVKGGWNPP
jgi:hypothetical protein